MEQRFVKKLKLLTLSYNFPNKLEPNSGIYVFKRAKALSKYCDIKVIAPVPWFPFLSFLRLFKKDYRLQPEFKELQDGLEVYHPRFLSIPVFLKSLDYFFYALSIKCIVKKFKKEWNFDVIDVHFIYPDGAGAYLLSKWLGLSYILTLRGIIYRASKDFFLKNKCRNALNNAKIIFSNNSDMKDIAVNLGADDKKIFVVPNGADVALFRPIDTIKARSKLGLPLDKQIILSVARLTRMKGFHTIIRAMPAILKKHQNCILVIVGGTSLEGDFSNQLYDLVKELNLEKSVIFAGPKLNKDLNYWYSACDVFCLASMYEGSPNVIYEALACGRPIVGTNISGIRDAVKSKDYGVLFPAEMPEKLANALIFALNKKWDYKKIRKYAEQNTWGEVAKKVYSKLENVYLN